MLGGGPVAGFSRYFTSLLTHESCLLHKSGLSSGIVVLDVSFLVICYVFQLPRLCSLFTPQHCGDGSYFSPNTNRAICKDFFKHNKETWRLNDVDQGGCGSLSGVAQTLEMLMNEPDLFIPTSDETKQNLRLSRFMRAKEARYPAKGSDPDIWKVP
jgi:hypothetical protein